MKRINENYLSIYEFIKRVVGYGVPSRSKDSDLFGFLIGVFQPVVSMLNDGLNTFKPYKSWYDVRKDVLQPLRGIFSILKGLALIALSIILSALAMCLTFIALIVNTIFNCFGKEIFEDYGFVKFLELNWVSLVLCLSSFIDGALRVVRGISQILATPLTWFLRIPLRAGLTAYYGTPDLFDNDDIIDLVKRASTEENAVYITKRLHYKLTKAINCGQETALIKNNNQLKEELTTEEKQLFNSVIITYQNGETKGVNRSNYNHYIQFFTKNSPKLQQEDYTYSPKQQS